MAVAFNIVLNSDKPPFNPSINSDNLARESEKISSLLESLELRDFDEFVSANPEEARAMLAEFGGDESEPVNEVELPEEQWFLPEEGLSVVRALASHLQQNPKAVRDVNGVLSDLKGMHGVLTKAAAAGLRWHLVIDF